MGCFREDRLVGDKDVGSILKVRWSEKELFDARVLFFGKLMLYVFCTVLIRSGRKMRIKIAGYICYIAICTQLA